MTIVAKFGSNCTRVALKCEVCECKGCEMIESSHDRSGQLD